MFITKKKFEEAIYNAKAEVEKEIWERERLDRMERNIHERIDRLEREVFNLKPARNAKVCANENTCVPDYY